MPCEIVKFEYHSWILHKGWQKIENKSKNFKWIFEKQNKMRGTKGKKNK